MKAILLVLGAACLLGGCINLHVHFPEAPAGDPAGSSRPPAPARP